MDSPTKAVQAQVQLKILGRPLELHFALPAGPTRSSELLPAIHSLTDSVISLTAQAARETGQLEVSCRKGCAACCRKLLLIAPAEAHRLAHLVGDLPEPQRGSVLSRFAKAIRALEAGGLLAELRAAPRMCEPELYDLGERFFRLWVDCPFLENEECVIYAERPLACREYAVFSPPEWCFPQSSQNEVDLMCLPAKPSRAVAAWNPPQDTSAAGWIPLVLALEWTAGNPEPPTARPAEQWLKVFLDQLSLSDR
jgi:Fe-S-cluster containining protein